MPREESEYLQDIVAAARHARAHACGLTFSEFTQSHLHQSAVQWELTVIGEASTRIGSDTKAAHTRIPWSQMIGMRNRIVHRYFRIDLDILWSVIQDDLPELIAELTPLVRSQAD